MAEEEDFIDVSVKNLDKMKARELMPEQLEEVKENRAGLTREGARYQLWLWMQSKNRYMKKMYLLMIAQCKNFTTSGKTVDGKTIFARKRGKIISYGDIDVVDKDLINMGFKV